ncbi:MULTISPECIES: hypothetical protein [unclassified Roseivivax]|uniref:hypothetical protein n=1 Tax=Roseivivax sp. GX 12232 TaxID=2900547 RepID=UPI001E49C93B|nr:hypothetical protein [Roseivivax sp. GX 12232]MCE0506848.1 hypothetical protein [Roseivivax sp. GX 12232]
MIRMMTLLAALGFALPAEAALMDAEPAEFFTAGDPAPYNPAELDRPQDLPPPIC